MTEQTITTSRGSRITTRPYTKHVRNHGPERAWESEVECRHGSLCFVLRDCQTRFQAFWMAVKIVAGLGALIAGIILVVLA